MNVFLLTLMHRQPAHLSFSLLPQALESTGLRREDPRLKEMIQNLERYQEEHDDQEDGGPGDLQKLVIGRKEFKR
jgi:hypothetical protein